MNPVVRLLFHEVADLSPKEREELFRARSVAPEIRAELESLLSYDSDGRISLTEPVSRVAERALLSGEVPAPSSCGPYLLIRQLGSGGMGAVYLAERRNGELQQQVAVKLLRPGADRPSWRERFLRERQLLAYLNHASVTRLLDAGHTEDGRPYLVMEYVDGVAIDSFAAGKPLREQLALFLEVCEGVAHAHRHLIVHRDLKPSNILVDASGQPKLLDFGIAKLLDETVDATQTMDRLLTPAYASPEQLRGGVQTTATDIYSLGAILYKLLTGRSPHESEERGSQAFEVASGSLEITAPSRVKPNLPADLDFILRKALRREPEERYASVEPFADDVRAFLDSRPVRARSGDAWYRTRKFLRRHRLPVGAVAVTVIGLSIGLYIANRERALAQQEFQEVRQLAGKLIDLDGDIRDLPGATKARNRIVSTSLAYLAALGPRARGDRGLALEIGDAYAQLARIQGVPIHSTLGQLEQARGTLLKAEPFLESVLAADPGNRRAVLLSAQVAHDRMAIAAVERKVPESLEQAAEAEVRLGRLARLGDLRPLEVAALAGMYSNVAIAYGNGHRYSDEIRVARRSLEVSSGVPAARGPRAVATAALASGLRWSGDLDGALAEVRASRALLETTRDNGVVYRVNLIESLFREGRILAEEGEVSMNRPAEAIPQLQKALDLAEEMAAKDPHDTNSRHRVAGAAAVLGSLLWRTDPPRALAVYDRGLGRTREIENNLEAQRDEATLLAGSSYALRSLHRADEAGRRIETAFQVLRRTKDYPAERIIPIDAPRTVVRALADQYAGTGRLKQAADTYRELLDKEMATNPDPENDLRNASYLSDDEVQFVGVLRRLGRQEEAAELEARRQALWRSWDRKLPHNPFVLRQMAARAD